MNEPNPKWRSIPILREIARQWSGCRGLETSFQRPFSRDWEQLLDKAKLTSGEDRGMADREARMLATAGLLELRFVPRRPHLIGKIVVPFAAETALRRLFPEYAQTTAPAFDWHSVDWEPELRFLLEEPADMAPDDLVSIDNFLKNGGRQSSVIPVKERSLQLFGDEKRLDEIRNLVLFRNGRLSLNMLRCEIVGEPLGWRRGPENTGVMLVIENAATWHSYSRWNCLVKAFSAVVYGGGNRFFDNVALLSDIIREVGPTQKILYFGDLDPQGIWIPVEASRRAQLMGLPAIHPDMWSYSQLFDLGQAQQSLLEADTPTRTESLQWLGHLQTQAKALFERKKRLPQEWINWEFLQHQTRWLDQG